MSYLRYGSPLEFIEGESEDYLFMTDDENGKEMIEDYGGHF